MGHSMPTEANEYILDRDLAKVAAAQVIELASPLLQELVNFSTHALVRCVSERGFQQEGDLAVVGLYRHIIEMTDGIETLVAQGCVIPGIPLLRSSFESLLYQEYILENEQDYIRRSLSWLVGYVHQRLALYERLDSSTARGQEFQRFVQDDSIARTVAFPPTTEAQEAIANLQSLLNQPHIQPIEIEFSSFGKKPNWYRLFEGPANLADLSSRLNRRALYELYRTWSRTAHGQDLLSFIDRTPEGEPAIGRLRDPELLKEVARYAAHFLIESTRRTVKKFRPGETFHHWYTREVQERYMRLSRLSPT
jgi:hypothetical protein